MPNFGTFLPHKGLKCSVRQIFPPRYILAVFPSSSGSAISGAVVGYVTGICRRVNEILVDYLCNFALSCHGFLLCYVQPSQYLILLLCWKLTSNSTSNSYFSRLWTYQHLPNHFVPKIKELFLHQIHIFPMTHSPSLFDSSRNQSESDALFDWTYCNYFVINQMEQEQLSQKYVTLINAISSSFSRCTHKSLSRGDARVFSSGMDCSCFLVPSSTIVNFNIFVRGDVFEILSLSMTIDDSTANFRMRISMIRSDFDDSCAKWKQSVHSISIQKTFKTTRHKSEFLKRHLSLVLS